MDKERFARDKGIFVHEEVVAALDDSNSTNRAFAQFSAERVLGRRLTVDEYDVLAGPQRRKRQVEALKAAVEKKQ